MDPEGFEPCVAPCKGPTFSMCFKIKNGPRGIRTLDLLNAIETRSQLRYGPGLIVFLLPFALPIPQKGATCAMGPDQLFFLLPFALPIPQKGAACAMGPD